jgi:uncharacterized membrane protein
LTNTKVMLNFKWSSTYVMKETDTSPVKVLVNRIDSIDFVRGLVMVLMAIDHVRVYSGLPAGGPEPGIFFTRWVTHFCAPVFVFLSGTSAYLYGLKLNNKAKLSGYLLTRGILLVVLELTVIRFLWTFNLDFANFVLAGVIWMIGWCMIFMAALVRLKPFVVGTVGLLIIFLQDLFALVPGLLPASSRPSFGRFWEFVYTSGLDAPPGITILYVLVPWIGVKAAGYGFGLFFQFEQRKRQKALVIAGGVSILAFVAFGVVKVLSHPDDNGMPFVMQLLNQRKYPASQLYLLMTLGPAILLMAFAEKITSIPGRALVVIGRVPFFYYLLHILVIHLSALLAQLIMFGKVSAEGYATAPYTWMPDAYRWGLGALYAVFAIDVVILYFLCKWYAAWKASRPESKWLRYL